MKYVKLPYTENIIWKIDKSDKITFKNIEKYKDKIESSKIHNVISYGGLIENYISLNLLNYLKIKKKNTNFIGQYDFYNLNKKIASCSTNSYLTNKDIIEKYPCPIFFDKDHNVYYNVLYNLYSDKNYVGINIGRHKRPILNIIHKNILYKDIYSNPLNIKKIQYSPNYLYWKSQNKKLLEIPYIIVIPEETKLSLHRTNFLSWTLDECIEFSNNMKKLGIFVIIMTSDKFIKKTEYNHISFGVSSFLDLVGSAFMVLSKDIDPILIKILKDPKGLYAFQRGKVSNASFYSIYKNIIYAQNTFDKEHIKNNVLSAKILSPNDIYCWLKDKM